MTMRRPYYWMYETSDVLRAAISAYLNGAPLDHEQIAAMRTYLRQWMAGDWQGPLIGVLRTQIETINTREDLTRWLDRALEADIDPL